jgi:hypothetical protein
VIALARSMLGADHFAEIVLVEYEPVNKSASDRVNDCCEDKNTKQACRQGAADVPDHEG